MPRSVCGRDAAEINHVKMLSPPLVVKPADKTLRLRGLVERAVRAALSSRIMPSRFARKRLARHGMYA